MSKHSLKSISSLTIGVVGAGSWGTALANLLAVKGYHIDLWVFETEVKEQIENDHINKVFLPSAVLSDNIVPTNDIKTAVAGKDIVLVVVPSHVMRETAGLMAEHIGQDTIVISASKGIENKTHLTMLGVLKDVLPSIPQDHLVALSGPSFAKEVAQQLPTVVAVASTSAKTAKLAQHVFATPRFRVYTNDDPMGVEVGVPLKTSSPLPQGFPMD